MKTQEAFPQDLQGRVYNIGPFYNKSNDLYFFHIHESPLQQCGSRLTTVFKIKTKSLIGKKCWLKFLDERPMRRHNFLTKESVCLFCGDVYGKSILDEIKILIEKNHSKSSFSKMNKAIRLLNK